MRVFAGADLYPGERTEAAAAIIGEGEAVPDGEGKGGIAIRQPVRVTLFAAPEAIECQRASHPQNLAIQGKAVKAARIANSTLSQWRFIASPPGTSEALADQVGSGALAVHSDAGKGAVVVILAAALDPDRTGGKEGAERVTGAKTKAIVTPTGVALGDPAATAGGAAAHLRRVDIDQADALTTAEGDGIAIVDVVEAESGCGENGEDAHRRGNARLSANLYSSTSDGSNWKSNRARTRPFKTRYCRKIGTPRVTASM